MSMLLWSYMDSVLWYKHHTFLQYDRNHNFHAILKLVWCSVTNYGKILHFQRIVFIVVATSWISSLLLMSSDSIQIVAAQFSIWSFNMVITWATLIPNFVVSFSNTFKVAGSLSLWEIWLPNSNLLSWNFQLLPNQPLTYFSTIYTTPSLVV